MDLIPPYPLIHSRLKSGKVIPFLGAGASLAKRKRGFKWRRGNPSYLPTAGELASHLAVATQFPNGEPPDLAKVAQYYDVVGGREALNEELHGIFNCDYPLTELHAFLAEICTPLLIVTTNYDDLIERALTRQSRPYDLVVHTTDPKIGDRLLWWANGETEPREVPSSKLDIDLQSVTVVYKMHGAVDRRQPGRDQYVITEDDYIDFLARMTKNKAIPAVVAEPFQTRHFLFLGYGLGDWNLRVVLNRVEKDLRRPKEITSWAIQHRPSALERRFWQERGVEVYPMELGNFVQQLRAH